MVKSAMQHKGAPVKAWLLVTTILTAAPVMANTMQPLPAYGMPGVVSDAELAQQRGGFFGRDGLQVAIGLEQSTTINGELAHRSVLRELSPLNSRESLPREVMEQVVIRTGLAGPEVQRTLSDSGWITTIQNEFDGQTIEHQITLDVELNNLSMPRTDLGRALERQLIDSARQH